MVADLALERDHLGSCCCVSGEGENREASQVSLMIGLVGQQQSGRTRTSSRPVEARATNSELVWGGMCQRGRNA